MKHCLGCMELYGDEFQICPYCGYVEGTPAEEKIHMDPGTLLHNRYIVGKVLGYGGFGVTYIGWDGKLEQKVAIKEYLPGEFSTRMPGQSTITIFSGDKSEQFRDGLIKFVEEAKRLARFQNEPGIVKIFDSFEENSTAYIIMEFLDGETLRSYLDREGPMGEDEAIKMLTPVMESLQTVHAEGILHRDIAPDNIFLTKNGEVKLIDFGASRYATTSHSRSLTVIIKPGYSAEEQYRSRGDQGPHTDVYSLGATLYKMITGKTPPDAMERRAKYENQNKDILVPPHVILKKEKSKTQISIDRENAILNAMNVRIEDRTPDVGTLLEELNSDKPVKRKQGKIKRIDLYNWPLWLKILIPTLLGVFIILGTLLLTGVIKLDKYKTEILLPKNTVVVPDVEGKTKNDALAELQTNNLGASITSKEYEYQPAGVVVVQDPLQGTYAIMNTEINLIISKGKGAEEAKDGVSTVPYLIGSTKEVALEDLTKAGLASPNITEEYSDEFAAGIVISQDPEAGTQLDEGSQITITVSLGGASFDLPSVVGKTMEEADAQLKALGLQVTIEQQANASVPSGQVISQSSPEGSKVKKGDSITIIVSSGVPTATVPSVIGTSASSAKSTLEKAGFTVKQEEQYSSSAAKGTVISQSPNANTTQAEGTQITIIVSKGAKTVETQTEPPTTEPPTTQPQKVSVANVVGKSQSEAETTLKNQGFKVTANEAYSTSVASGKVISQNPSAGTSVEKGATITITVSKGTEKINVANVVGKSLSEAKATLEGQGFTVSSSEEYSSSVAAGKVISQNPASGTKLEKGTTVNLVVSKGKQSVTVTLDPNGGSVSGSSITVIPGESYGSIPTPSKDYCTFDGWHTESGDSITSSTTVSLTSNHKLIAHWKDKPVSDWVLQSQMPDGARVVETKYTYDYTETTESENSTMSGWTQTGSYWKQTGSGSCNYASFPSGFDTSHSIYKSFEKSAYSSYENSNKKREVSNSWAGYVYYKWSYNAQYANRTDRTISPVRLTSGTNGYAYIYFRAHTSSTNHPYLDNYYCNSYGYACYNCSSEFNNTDLAGESPRFHRFDYYKSTYTDYTKMYNYSRTTHQESSSAVSPSSSISNVQVWVRYQSK